MWSCSAAPVHDNSFLDSYTRRKRIKKFDRLFHVYDFCSCTFLKLWKWVSHKSHWKMVVVSFDFFWSHYFPHEGHQYSSFRSSVKNVLHCEWARVHATSLEYIITLIHWLHGKTVWGSSDNISSVGSFLFIEKALTSNGANADASRASDGTTSLMKAARNGHLAIVKVCC